MVVTYSSDSETDHSLWDEPVLVAAHFRPVSVRYGQSAAHADPRHDGEDQEEVLPCGHGAEQHGQKQDEGGHHRCHLTTEPARNMLENEDFLNKVLNNLNPISLKEYIPQDSGALVPVG